MNYLISQLRGRYAIINDDLDDSEDTIVDIRARVDQSKVICGLSGGVDSSVVAALLHKAVGDRLSCIFVDNGLLRKNEAELVEATFRDHFHVDLRVVDASERFLKAPKASLQRSRAK